MMRYLRSGSISARISSSALRSKVGSRNSSTYFMSSLRRAVVGRITVGFFLGRARFAQLSEHLQLLGRLCLADAAHRKADMHQHPIANGWRVVFQQLHVNLAAD